MRTDAARFVRLTVTLVLLGASAIALPLEKRLVEIRVTEGTNMAFSLSPDERTLVMDLQGTLWRLPANGGRATSITDPLVESRYPAFSPSGEWIAFQCYGPDNWHICIVRPDGSGHRTVTAGGYDHREPYWHPDGRSIVFTSDRNGTYDLWSVSLEDGELRQLTETGSDEEYPSVSPDGDSIVYSVSGSEGASIVVLSEGRTEAVFESTNALALPEWSQDGHEIAFFEFDRDAGMGVLKAVDVDDGSVRDLSTTGEDVFHSRPSWLRDGGVLYAGDGGFVRRRDATNADRIDFETTFALERHEFAGKEHAFDTDAEQRTRGIYNPVLSPGGDEVAFAALGDIWVQSFQADSLRQLTHDGFLQIDPAWSPDGRFIAYASDHGSPGTMQLWRYDTEADRHERIFASADNVSLPAYSPDGRRVAFLLSDASDWHARYVHVLDIETGGPRRVYDWLFMPSRPTWSPDGVSVSLSAQRTYSDRFRKGANEILSIDVETGEGEWWTPFPDQTMDIRGTSGPIWSPDGRHLAYTFDGTLWISPMGPEGRPAGPARRLTRELANAISWSGDSASILFLSGRELQQIFLDDGRMVRHPIDLQWKPKYASGRVVIRAGRLFDAVSDNYRHDVDVRIENGRIVSIVPAGQRWRGARLIDASENTVIPGLIESHIHQFAANGERTGRLPFSFGVTSVREVGADPYEALMFKEAWASGSLVGPRQFYSGLLEGDRVYYSMSLPITTGHRLQLELERALELDYDLIKTYERLSDHNLRRVIRFAHRHGLTVTSHELYPAVSIGADGVEHISSSDRRSRLDGDRLSPGGRAYADVISLVADSGVALTPTIFWGRDVILSANGWSPTQSRQFSQLLPERFQTLVGLDAGPDRAVDGLVRSLEQRQSAIREMFQRGATILAGTDTSFYLAGLSLILEISEFVQAGIPAHEALRTATIHAARALRVEQDLGTIEEGKLADIVVIDGDPLRDPMDLLNVVGVMKGGSYYSLDSLLETQDLSVADRP